MTIGPNNVQNGAAHICSDNALASLLKLLGEMDRQPQGGTGANQYEQTSQRVTSANPPTLSEMGISRMQSSRWQSIAALPQEEFDTHIEERSTAFGQSNPLVRVRAH